MEKTDVFGRRIKTHRNSDEQQDEDDEAWLKDTFTAKTYSSMGSLESYVTQISDHNLDDLSGPIRQRAASQVGTKHHRLSQIPSYHSALSAVGESKRRSSVNPKNKAIIDAGKGRLYAGIVHSDLDIQTSRPPYMYQMNFIEWLWLHSTVRHRVNLMLLAFFLFIIVGHLLFAIDMLIRIEKKIRNPYLCTTIECKNLARRISTSMNKSVHPCEDFYGFVCGTSGVQNLSVDKDSKWNHGFDVGRITYNYVNSLSLGRMLKSKKTFPQHLVLDMYKACLNKREREKIGLQPFYDIMKELKLYGLGNTKSLSINDVTESIARINAYTLHKAAMIKVVFYDDANGVKAFITRSITEPIQPGAVHRYGYDVYFKTIQDVFTYLSELNSPPLTPEEIEIIAHDIVCLELYVRDGFSKPQDGIYYMFPLFPDDPAFKYCHIGPTWDNNDPRMGEPPANFGIAAMNEKFDYSHLIKIMFELANPEGFNVTDLPQDPQNDPESDKEYLDVIDNTLKISAPIRILRYLQWRVVYHLGLEVNSNVTDIMVNVLRYVYRGQVPNCFHSVFYYLPHLAPARFLEQVPSHAEINAKYGKMTTMVEESFAKLVADIKFAEMSKYPNLPPMSNQTKVLLKIILSIGLSTHDVSPLNFSSTSIKPTCLTKLFENITFDENSHLKNIFKMGFRIHEWQTKSMFKDIYYNIDRKIRVQIMIDGTQTPFSASTQEYVIYLPLGIIEAPFLEDGLLVSDAGGFGLSYAFAHHKTFMITMLYNLKIETIRKKISDKLVQLGFTNSTEQTKAIQNALTKYMIPYFSYLLNKLNKQRSTWKSGDWVWDDNFLTGASGRQALMIALIDQAQYHVIVNMVNTYVDDPANRKEVKKVLVNLDQFNAKQLFYITLVNRRCEEVGPQKFDHFYSYGPVIQSVRNNVVLSNLDDFGKTFNCPLGSPMNRKDKIYFWDP